MLAASIRKKPPKFPRIALDDEDQPPENLNITLKGMRISIEVDSDFYDDDEYVKIREIVKRMSRNIWIDRTYVCFKGNRFTDAFINEKEWKKLIKLIIDSDYGKNVTEEEEDKLAKSFVTIGICYLYSILISFGYDVSHIELEPSSLSFTASYEDDYRTSWDF